MNPRGHLQAGIHITGATTIRQITGDIFELARLPALGALPGGSGRLDVEAALTAFPKGFHSLTAHCLLLLSFLGSVPGEMPSSLEMILMHSCTNTVFVLSGQV